MENRKQTFRGRRCKAQDPYERVYKTEELISDFDNLASESRQFGTDWIYNFDKLQKCDLLKEDESDAYSTVLLLAQRIGPHQFSGNVPLGSGNRRPGQYSGRYYTESDAGLLTETNQEIIAEDDT